MKTIVVGCDLSPPSDVALERAVALAAHHRATLVLVHAQADDAPKHEVDNAMLAQLGQVSAAVRAGEARELARRIAGIESRGVTTALVSRIGAPDEVLAAAAAERGADMIVVGTHGSTGLTRFLLGSVASSAIRHGVCDVLVVRGAGSGLYRRPLVAIDFSTSTEATLAHAADLSEADAPLELVHAWQLPTGAWGATLFGQARFPWSSVRDAVVDGARRQAEKVITDNARIGRPMHVELIQGPPAQVITSAAEKAGHDLIVVGSHGHRGVRRLLLGSVAESTVRHAPCSVLVVHGYEPQPG